MSDDTDDDNCTVFEEIDVSTFHDVVSQRSIAFVHLARFAETCADQTAKELTFTMMRKVSMSIKTPSTADLKVVE